MFAWGAFVGRRPFRVLAVATLCVLLCAIYGSGVFGSLSDGGFEDPDSESSDVRTLVDTYFGEQRVDVVAIYSSDDLIVTEPEFRDAVGQVVGDLRAAGVQRVVSYYEVPDPALISSDQHATRLMITLPGEGELTDEYDTIEPLLKADGLSSKIAGQYALFKDANHQVEHDIVKAEIITLPLVFLLSLLVFGSLTAALMPTLVGAVAVAGAFALVRLITHVADVSVFSINVITLMGMGLAIDYALFIVARFREELGGSSDRDAISAALARTLATAGRTVFFSGVIVAASLASLLLFPEVFLKSMGYGGMAAVLVAMIASLTVLPAVIGVLGPRLEWGRVRGRRSKGNRKGRRAAPRQRWAAIARAVMRRPILTIVLVTAAMLALGSPILGAKWGGVDERVMPQSSPSRQAAEANAELFGGDSASAEIIAIDLDTTDLAALQAAIEGVPGIDAVSLAGSHTEGESTYTWLQAHWQGRGQVPASQDVARDLRKAAEPFGALVGGESATTVDLVESIGSTLPKMGMVVAGVMFVLLFIAFGSLVLPIKAMLMNAISISASFGAVTWIFQDGHLSGLLGFTSPGYLDATQPILMLAVLFGLSMDYEVFLLSRIREEWDRTHTNELAVITGVQRTGWLITSAALLLSVVIGGFATSGIVFLKMIGVGMLVAVLLDATVVRALLVPATMRLLGKANWWAPGPLARWWERYGHRSHSADAEPVPPLDPPSPQPAGRHL
ncbi:MAG: MMPL family transporter [Nocardioides sp.]